MMPEIKPCKILSFSSEDELYPAKNLLRGSSSYQWKCKSTLNTQSYVEFLFESLTKFSRIDIGNSSSAFIEVQVSCVTDHENYQVLLGSTPLLSPSEALKCENLNRVRCFKDLNFTRSVASKKWNVLKVICTQPFNKTLQYGLSFIKFYEILNENDTQIEKVQLNESHIDLEKLLTAKQSDVENWRPGCLFKHRNKTDSVHEEVKILNTESQKSFNNFEIKIPPIEDLKKETGDKVPLELDNHSSLAKLNSETVKFPSMKSSINLKRKHDSLAPDVSEVKGSGNSVNQKSGFLKNQTDIKSTKGEIKKVKTDITITSNSQSKVKHDTTTRLIQKSSPDDLLTASSIANNSLQPHSSALNDSIFSNVIFVLSGYQNPLRNKIRDQALSLGAQYRASWVNDCTHLICAYPNTPKFREACSKGIIVTEKWIFDCYNEKKLLPWRKYRVTGALSPVKSISSHPTQSIKSVNRNEDLSYNSGISAQSNTADINGCVNDGLFTSSLACIDVPIPKLPNIFIGQDFFFYGNFDNEELRQLKRLIIAFNGTVHTFMTCEVRIVLTHCCWDEHFDKALDSNSKLKFVQPEWIYLCDEQGSLAPFDKFEILK